MADLPRYISIADPYAFQHQLYESGVEALPPLVKEDEEYLLYKDDWEKFVSKQGVCFKWDSFAALFKVDANDGCLYNLSAKDLRLETQKSAECSFKKEYGYPEAIISDCALTILRMEDGTYWEYDSEGSCEFKSMPYEEGMRIERKVAGDILEKMDDEFDMAMFDEESDGTHNHKNNKNTKTFAMKKSSKSKGMSSTSSQGIMDSPLYELQRLSGERLREIFIAALKKFFKAALKKSIEKEIRLSEYADFPAKNSFADQNYLLGNSESRIAYHPDGDIGRYFISQGLNECVSAAILNANISVGMDIPNDKEVLSKFHKKIAKMTGSKDGRIDLLQLIDLITSEKIPGMTAQILEDDIDKIIKKGTPTIASVHYFGGHAAAVIGKGQQENSYLMIDTITGMQQEIKPNYYNEGFLEFIITDRDEFLEWVQAK